MHLNVTKYLIKWTAALVVLLAFASCQNDDFLRNDGYSSNEITVPFSSSDSHVVTRSTQSSQYENRINNLYLLLFNSETGEKVSGTYYTSEELYEASNGTDYNSGYLNLKIPHGISVRAYGVANIDGEVLSIYREELEYINQLEELKQLKVELVQRTIARGSSFTMFGTIEDQFGTPYLLNSQIGASKERYQLLLKRLDAKICFHISAVNGATFTPRDWAVKRVSTQRKIYPTSQSSNNADNRYFDTENMPFEEDGKGFSFYALENLQVPSQRIDERNPSEAYNYREKQYKYSFGESNKYGQTCVNGEFIYAPQQATYVVFTGELSYIDPQTNLETVADVKYTIHLGYQDKDPNDYAIIRNTEYHYYIRLKSAHNIELEVTTGVERQPGAEGHITKGKQNIEVDAHFNTQVLSFHYDDIDYVTWYIKTPFAEGYREDFHGKPNSGDSDWILFKLNRRDKLLDWYHRVVHDKFSKEMEEFPGSKHRHKPDAKIQHLMNYKKGKLMTANQLIRVLHYSKLHEQKDYRGNNYGHHYFDDNNEIVVTAYINENYYTKHPTKGHTSPTLWKDFVNQPERVFSFINSSKYSPDGNSSIKESFLTIRQQAIQTIYNTKNSNLISAWGTESIQETELLPYDTYPVYEDYHNRERHPSYSSSSNGRLNQLEINRERKSKDSQMNYWRTVIDYRDNSLKSSYKAIKYACLQRNRDENGDGIINDDEVKWYLTARDQLTDLWIGENSINQKAKLYNPQNGDKDAWYISSSVNDEVRGDRSSNPWLPGNSYEYWDNPWAIWAKEGSSISLASQLPYFTPRTEYNYRCVRNLGMDDTTHANDVPQDFIQVKGNTIKLPFLDKQSIRKYTQTAELPLHHERDSDNMPWTSFNVAPETSLYQGYRTFNWVQLQQLIDRGKSPCPTGYRVPNQRELAIMISRLPDRYEWNLENHFSRTAYSMNPIGGSKHGFSVIKRGEMLYLINSYFDKGGVRCVKDNN